MKISILGYGKMGKEIEKLAKSQQIRVSKIISTYDDLLKSTFAQDEIVIEFTEPTKCYDNLRVLLEKRAKVVCGTTGWYQHLDEIKDIVNCNRLSFIYGENFAIGVHLFWKVVREASKIFNDFPEYNISFSEHHHKTKKDFPSGTAQKTADILIKNIERKKYYSSALGIDKSKINKDEEISISCIREDGHVGRHDLSFYSKNDSIEINHISKGRTSYALGAIKCAEWLLNKQGFFTIEDYINSIR